MSESPAVMHQLIGHDRLQPEKSRVFGEPEARIKRARQALKSAWLALEADGIDPTGWTFQIVHADNHHRVIETSDASVGRTASERLWADTPYADSEAMAEYARRMNAYWHVRAELANGVTVQLTRNRKSFTGALNDLDTVMEPLGLSCDRSGLRQKRPVPHIREIRIYCWTPDAFSDCGIVPANPPSYLKTFPHHLVLHK